MKGLLTCFLAAVLLAGFGCASSSGVPEGFTSLLNRNDLSEWKGFVADPPKRAAMSPQELQTAQRDADERMRRHWSLRDGVLYFDGKGENLVSARDYQDFELLLDWKVEPKGDSGVYLRGCPQVQIWDNPIGSGGLYNNQKGRSTPLVIADRPVGEWNTFRITMRGERVWVVLNGFTVVDGEVLENYFERSRPVYERGPIELQSHGDRLQFRNIFIRELWRVVASQ